MDISEQTILRGPLEAIHQSLRAEHGDADRFQQIVEHSRQLTAIFQEVDRPVFAEATDILAQFAEMAQQSLAETHSWEDVSPVMQILTQGFSTLQAAIDDEPSATQTLIEFVQTTKEDWCDVLTADYEWTYGAWPMPQQIDEADSGDQHPPDEPNAEQISKLLAACQFHDGSEEPLQEPPATTPANPEASTTKSSDATPPSEPAVGTIADDELRQAFLDDCQRCLSSMEQAVMSLEEDVSRKEPLRQLCRELHTLKGASATVGLSDLSSYLHSIEDSLEACCKDDHERPDVESVLQCVDTVRHQMQALHEAPALQPQTPTEAEEPPTPSTAVIEDVIDRNEETIRVKASRIDRLMDMLAELIMLRNQRDSRLAEHEQLRAEMLRCVSRLRLIHDGVRHTRTATVATPAWNNSSDSLSEVANDVVEMTRRLQEINVPVTEENRTISRLVRQFRQELVALRRMPMTGLFRRLQRVARDAARVEDKQVRLTLAGDHAGLEKSMQERLYEPLLHIVRNAVSHGIESPERRAAAGKDTTGQISLEAHGNPNLLIISIRDDGHGLDYEALRRKGLELGFLSPDQPASREELAQLIFRQGFSTRSTTNAVAGRGVGMDVVAHTLERMGSWVQIESEPGQGTTMQLHIPLRSVIEHAMVFRSRNQLYAIPMHFVRQSANSDQDTRDLGGLERVSFNDIFTVSGTPKAYRDQGQLLVLGDDGKRSTDTSQDAAAVRRVGLEVDEVVGPEEVVLRSLPPILRRQKLFCGVTLSGTGEVVLVFDGSRLIDYAIDGSSQPAATSDAACAPPQTSEKPKVLVVDDSFSIRREMVRMIHELGFDVEQAGDGVEARTLIRKHNFVAVFTDLEMPRLNGMGLLQDIRQHSASATLPVVVVSSRNEDTIRDQAMERGATDYVVKPITADRIRSYLQVFTEPVTA